jgi:biotin carboxyl carrier protein
MLNNENINGPDKDKEKLKEESITPEDKSGNIEAEEDSETESEPLYTENDIVQLDGAEYHTNYTNKYLASKGYKPKTKDTEMHAFLPGQIIRVFIKKKKKVKAFDKLISFEAMKMINDITLNDDIKIEEVFVKKGDTVEKGQLLFKYKVIPQKK